MSAAQRSAVAYDGNDSDSSNADTAVPVSCIAIVSAPLPLSPSIAIVGQQRAGRTRPFFSFPIFCHRRPMFSLPVRACVRVLSPAVPRCDTVDSDSSRAVVPEMFHVAPHGTVLRCIVPCAVRCVLLYAPVPCPREDTNSDSSWAVGCPCRLCPLSCPMCCALGLCCKSLACGKTLSVLVLCRAPHWHI